ncbi:hypothetical protein WNY78_06585 [Psychroserpens sp. AS72]|uniref:hypothetical protein n=1 Tax=Psychroserpens sp. AS72 TaxID=3135775 RepID=UPI003182486C
MKKSFTLLIIILLAFTFSCSEDDNKPITNFEARIIRLDNSINAIAPKSIYMPSEDFQVTSYFKFDNQGNIERLSHLVGDDGSDTSTIISFNENGNINSIYQQNTTSGSLSNIAYLIYENGTLYYGTEAETSQNDNTSELDSYAFIEDSADDIILSNTLNQNIDVLEHIKFLSENSNRNSQASQSSWLAAAVTIAIIAGIIYWIDNNPEDFPVYNCVFNDVCNFSRSSSFSQNNACSPNYSQFICSNEDLILDMLEDTSELEIDLCDGQICLINNFQGNWVGTYSGNDNGTWNIDVSQYGIVSGTATSTIFNQSFNISGNISLNGILTATLGNVSSGSTFIGEMVENNASGTWNNNELNMNGNWSGSKNQVSLNFSTFISNGNLNCDGGGVIGGSNITFFLDGSVNYGIYGTGNYTFDGTNLTFIVEKIGTTSQVCNSVQEELENTQVYEFNGVYDGTNYVGTSMYTSQTENHSQGCNYETLACSGNIIF